MKDQPLEALISDPAFDPTHWMLRAFKHYIEHNPEVILEDETCRPYLLKAMERDQDWCKLFRRMPPNVEIVSDTLIAFNSEVKKELNLDYSKQTINKRSHRKLIERLVEFSENSQEKWGKLLLEVPTLKAQPKMVLIRQMTSEEVLRGVKSWNTSDWQTGFWNLIVQYLDPPELIKLIVWDKFPDAVCSTRKMGYSDSDQEVKLLKTRMTKFQDMLINILARIHDFALIEFEDLLDRIESSTLEKLYCKSRNSKNDLVPDNRIWRPVSEYGWTTLAKTEPKLNELLCRCGYMCNSSSGLALHRKNCQYGKYMSVFKAFRLKLARCNGATELTCNRCGKACKSKPGYTLHRKSCQVHYSDADLFKLCM